MRRSDDELWHELTHWEAAGCGSPGDAFEEGDIGGTDQTDDPDETNASSNNGGGSGGGCP